jgi:hypothetical protein
LTTDSAVIPQEIIDTGSSFERYAPVSLKIQNEESELIPFSFNPVQDILHQIYRDIENNGRLIRCWILKARREGVTTDTTGMFYYKTTHGRNRYAYHITHEPEATDFVFNMVKRYYAHAPLRPLTKYNNKKALEFNTEDGNGLDSAIRVGTAGKDDLGSGQLIHYLHLSEIAKWKAKKVKPLLTSLMQCVPSNPGTMVIGESTAKGIGGEFYEGFWNARYVYEVYLHRGKPTFRCRVNQTADKNNDFSAIFIPWFVFPKYKRDPEPGFERTAAERQMVTLYGIHDGHLQFRRWAIQNKCGGDPMVFQQEYPSNADEAFIAGGRPVFKPVADVLARKRVLEAAYYAAVKAGKDPRKYYRFEFSTGQWQSATPENGDVESLLQVFAEPRGGSLYTIGADVSEGIEVSDGKADFSSVHVVETLSGREVAVWHGKIAPDLFGVMLYHMGKRYNWAYMAPERNNHGFTTVTKLFDMNYPELHVDVIEEAPLKPRKRYGWLTGSNKTKHAGVIDTLRAEFRDRPENFRDPETLGEMLSFKELPDGGMEAEEGRFDDRVMSRAIANKARERAPRASRNTAADNVPVSPTAGGASGSPGMGGFT